MVKLGIRVPYHDGETPASFASRLAARNLRPSARYFCLDMGFTFQNVVDGIPDVLNTLAELGGADPEQIQHAALRRIDTRTFSLNGERVLGSLVLRNPLVVCPHCLIEDADGSSLQPEVAMFGRAIWQIRAIRTCPTHQVPLIQLDTAEDRETLHDFAAQIAPLRNSLPPLTDHRPPRSPTGFELYLLSRLSGCQARAVWLDELGFSAALKTCEMLGAVAEFGRTPNLKELTSDEWRQAGASGFEILRHGPDSLKAYLSSLQDRHNVEGAAGPQAMFGRFYQWLAFAAKDPDIDPVRDIVREHIIDTMPVGAGETVLGKAVPDRKIHSVSTAAEEYGLHILTLRKALHVAGLVPAPDAPVHSAQAVFDAVTTAPLLHELANGISLKEVRSYLNIPRVQAKVLMDAGIITPILPPEQMAPLFFKGYLDDFLSRLTHAATEVDTYEAPMMNLQTASRHACCSSTVIVKMVLGNELSRVERTTQDWGYLSILVDADEVRAKVAGPDREGVVPSTIPSDFGIKTRAVREFMDVGILPVKIGINPVNKCPQRLIPFDAYARFKSEYISLRDVALKLGVVSRRALSELSEKGTFTVREFEKHGAHIYRRDQFT